MTKQLLAAAAAVGLLALDPALPLAQNDDNEAKRVRDGATVFGEIMANLKDLHLDLTTFGHWETPHDSEVLDEPHRNVVLDRIVAALGHLGYAVRLWDPETRSWRPPDKTPSPAS